MTQVADLLALHGALLVRWDAAARAFPFPEGMDDIEATAPSSASITSSREAPCTSSARTALSRPHRDPGAARPRRCGRPLEPAEEIFVGRISEKALTETVLLSDRGEGAPVTVTRLGDLVLPARAAIPSLAERAAAALWRKSCSASGRPEACASWASAREALRTPPRCGLRRRWPTPANGPSRQRASRL